MATQFSVFDVEEMNVVGNPDFTLQSRAGEFNPNYLNRDGRFYQVINHSIEYEIVEWQHAVPIESAQQALWPECRCLYQYIFSFGLLKFKFKPAFAGHFHFSI